MSEILGPSEIPESRVFGNAFSFSNGAADEETRAAFFAERYETIQAEGFGWLPRTLDSDYGVAADLYKDRKIIATVSLEYDSHLADVYITGEGGIYGETTLLGQLPFAEAVKAAEAYAADS